MTLQELIRSLIDEIIEEESLSGDVGAYSTPYAFSRNKKAKNAATKTAQHQGMQLVKKPKTSKVVDIKKLNEEQPRFTSNISGAAPKKGGKLPKIPTEVPLPKELVGKDKPFSVATGPTGTILTAVPMAKIALDAIEKGRTSFEKEEKLYAMTRLFKDKLPGETRRVIKKGLDGARLSGDRYVVNAEVLDDKGDNIMLKNISKDYEITPEGIAVLKALKSKQPLPKGVELKDASIKQLISIFLKQDTNWAPAELVNFGLVKAKDEFRIQNKLYENIAGLIDKEIINEVTYGQFKKEAKFRTKSEQLHKAIKDVKRKIQEINRIVEYTSRMKQELSEDGGLNYWKATEKYVGQISEMVNHLGNKLKNLNQ